jgi:hypothetical protein
MYKTEWFTFVQFSVYNCTASYKNVCPLCIHGKEACCVSLLVEYHHRVMVKYEHTSTHTWTHYDKQLCLLNRMSCCYNSCTILNPTDHNQCQIWTQTPLCSWALSLEDCAYCIGFSGVMLAWHDNKPNLFQYILWVSIHQNQQRLIRNNKLKLLLRMFPLDFSNRTVESASSMF